MSRDQGAYVADMLEACERVCAYVTGTTHDSLKTENGRCRASQSRGAGRGCQARLGGDTRALPSDPVACDHRLSGRLIHDYFGVDLDIVCDVAFVKVPTLRDELRALLRTIDEA